MEKRRTTAQTQNETISERTNILQKNGMVAQNKPTKIFATVLGCVKALRIKIYDRLTQSPIKAGLLRKVMPQLIILQIVMICLNPSALSASTKDFIFYEDFNSMEKGKRPKANTAITLQESALEYGRIAVQADKPADNYLHIRVGEPKVIQGATVDFAKQTEDFELQFDFKAISGSPNIVIGAPDLNVFPSFHSGRFGFFDGANRVDAMDFKFEKEVWVNIRLSIRPGQRKYDVYCDQQLVLSNLTFRTNNTVISSVRFTGGLTQTHTNVEFGIDNIFIYKRQSAEDLESLIAAQQRQTKTVREDIYYEIPELNAVDVLQNTAVFKVNSEYAVRRGFVFPIDRVGGALIIADGIVKIPTTVLGETLSLECRVELDRVVVNNNLVFSLSQPVVWYDGVEFTTASNPTVIDKTVYLPLAFTVEMLGGYVSQDGEFIFVNMEEIIYKARLKPFHDWLLGIIEQ